MAKLISNVYVDGKGYGPAHGNESDVPADVAERIGAHAWDFEDSPAEPVIVPEPIITPEAETTPPGIPEPAAPTPEPAPVVPDEPSPLLRLLAEIPDDKDDLIAFRDRLHLDVDGRLGAEKLRAALAEALAPPAS